MDKVVALVIGVIFGMVLAFLFDWFWYKQVKEAWLEAISDWRTLYEKTKEG